MLVEWENREIAYERLSELGADDPVCCAEYGKKHGLLDQLGWKKLYRFASKRLIRAIKDPGYTKSEHSSDIIMVLTSQKITKMPNS